MKKPLISFNVYKVCILPIIVYALYRIDYQIRTNRKKEYYAMSRKFIFTLVLPINEESVEKDCGSCFDSRIPPSE